MDGEASRQAFAGGVAYGTLLQLREMLRNRDYERAARATQCGIEALERVLLPPAPRREKGGDS